MPSIPIFRRDSRTKTSQANKMALLTFETPKSLIERLEQTVVQTWQESGRAFGRTPDPFTQMERDGSCVVSAPGCLLAISREPFSLWINLLESRLIEWPEERRTKSRPTATRLMEMLPGVLEDFLSAAAMRLGLAGNPQAHARTWVRQVDFDLAMIDPEIARRAQSLLDRWHRRLQSPTMESEEELLKREIQLVTDRDGADRSRHLAVRSLLLRLMQSASASAGPEIATAARGAVETLDRIARSAVNGTPPETMNRDLRTAIQAWVDLMDHMADRLVIPGGRLPYPTSPAELDLRFRFPPRLLDLWIRRVRILAQVVEAGLLTAHVDADLVSVLPEALDQCRFDRVVGALVFISALLQFNQGEPAIQDEMSALADVLLPVIEDPTRVGLLPAHRGARGARQCALLPRAVAMGRELNRRGLSLSLGRRDYLWKISLDRSADALYFCFPCKLGPEQHLPCAHMLVARSFEEVEEIFH